MHAPDVTSPTARPTRRDWTRASLAGFAALACALVFALPGGASAADYLLGVDSSAPVVIDKIGFSESGGLSLNSLYPLDLGAEQGDIQHATLRYFSLPDIASAGPEGFAFSFNPPAGSSTAFGDPVASVDVQWNTVTGHITSDPIPVRLHFGGSGGSSSADFDLILTTDTSLLPRFCNLNALEFEPIGEPLFDGQLVLAGAACAQPSDTGLNDFGIQVEIPLELLDGVDLGVCGDGIDNDNDGRTDLFDPGCDDFSDDSEKSDLLPCDDGIDNDGDGKVDHPADPECDSPGAPAEQAVCGDGFITPGETCDDGNSVGGDCCSASCQLEGAGSACNDANVCTQVDTCDSGGRCRGFSPLSCSDGLFCNGNETCDPITGCGPGSPPGLSDGIACTTDTCNEQTDSIQHTPVDALCEDGRFCSGERTCSPVLGCQSSPPNLNDGVSCTIDFCNEGADRVEHAPNDSLCDDGISCNGIETCSTTLDCQTGTPFNIDDGIACTVDECTAQGVKHTVTHSLCDDGLYCTGVELCDAQQGCLAGTPPNTSDDGIACTTTVCDEASKTNIQVPDDALCDDGLFCNGAERCFKASGCLPGVPLPINDFISCTQDSCDEATDTISHTPIDATCDDGLFCNGTEVCNASLGCQSTGTPSVDDGIDCTNDFCDENANAVVHQPFHFRCDDGLFCTGVETCQLGVGCTSTAPPGLDDGVACTSDECDESDRSFTHVPVDAACDDGAFCNGSESCHATLDCQAGIAPATDDGVGCTADSCDETGDELVHAPVDVLCDDSDPCTADRCDALLGCASDPIPGCGLPDLRVSDVTGAQQALPGERVSATASVVQMIESSPALGPVDVSFFLSSDMDIDSGDDMMLGFCEIDELTGGAVEGCEQSALEIPGDLVEPGEQALFYWGACADEIGAIDESQEDNNCAPGSTIMVPEPTAWLLQLAALSALLMWRLVAQKARTARGRQLARVRARPF